MGHGVDYQAHEALASRGTLDWENSSAVDHAIFQLFVTNLAIHVCKFLEGLSDLGDLGQALWTAHLGLETRLTTDFLPFHSPAWQFHFLLLSFLFNNFLTDFLPYIFIKRPKLWKQQQPAACGRSIWAWAGFKNAIYFGRQSLWVLTGRGRVCLQWATSYGKGKVNKDLREAITPQRVLWKAIKKALTLYLISNADENFCNYNSNTYWKKKAEAWGVWHGRLLWREKEERAPKFSLITFLYILYF